MNHCGSVVSTRFAAAAGFSLDNVPELFKCFGELQRQRREVFVTAEVKVELSPGKALQSKAATYHR